VLHIPFTTFQRVFNTGDEVGWMALTAKPGASAAALEEEAKALLAERHTIHPDDKLALGSYNAQEEFQRIQNLFTGMRTLVWFVGGMTLLSGIIGVSNVMLISVAERTREIGVRRAIGATRRSIMWMILREAIVLTAAAGYAGLMAGIIATEALGLLVGEGSEVLSEPHVDVTSALAAAGLLVIAGAFSGLMPAWRAANIHPVEALRAE
jgi:putative ABC transport system permease protein